MLAHVFRESGPIREALVYERRRFERLVQLIHRLPAREVMADVPDPRSRSLARDGVLPAFVVARDGLYLRKRSLLGLSQTKVGRVAHLPEGRSSSTTRCRRSPRT